MKSGFKKKKKKKKELVGPTVPMAITFDFTTKLENLLYRWIALDEKIDMKKFYTSLRSCLWGYFIVKLSVYG